MSEFLEKAVIEQWRAPNGVKFFLGAAYAFLEVGGYTKDAEDMNTLAAVLLTKKEIEREEAV